MTDVKPINAGMQRGERYWGVSFRTDKPADALLDNQWEKQGIYRQRIDDYPELPDWLFEICQSANEL